MKYFGFGKIIRFLVPYKRQIGLMVVLGLFSSLADSLFPLFNRYALEHFIAGKSFDGMGVFIALYVGLVILQEMDNYYCLFEAGRIEMCVDRDLREEAFTHLQTLSFSYFNQNSVGYIHARIMSDTAKIGELVAWKMMDVVWNLSYIICILVIMFTIDMRLAFWIVALIPVAVILILFFQKRLVGLNRKIREMNGLITAHFNEGITGARTIKTLAVENVMTHDFFSDTQKMRHSSIRSAHSSALLSSLVALLSSVALASILWQSSTRLDTDPIPIGTLSVFMAYALGLLSPIQGLISTFSSLIAIQVNIERFSALLEQESDVADRKDVIEKYGDMQVLNHTVTYDD